MLRRQVKRPLRKPLIALTPKSLLRHKEAVSSLDDLCEGTFRTVLPPKEMPDPRKVTRLIMCSGKVYFDLLEKLRSDKREDTLIVRIEQLYPFPHDDLDAVLAPYRKIKTAVWCQEEPMNQGAWYCSQHHMRQALGRLSPKLVLQYAGAHHPRRRLRAMPVFMRRNRNNSLKMRSLSDEQQPKGKAMTTDIKAPVFPESVAEGTIATWHKQPENNASGMSSSWTSRPIRSCWKWLLPLTVSFFRGHQR